MRIISVPLSLAALLILPACQTAQVPHQPATNWAQFQENCAVQNGSQEACACMVRSLSGSVSYEQYRDLSIAGLQKALAARAEPRPTGPPGTKIPLARPRDETQDETDPLFRLNKQAAMSCQTPILGAIQRPQ